MRHGLIQWDEADLSTESVRARQARLQQALVDEGLDGLLIYTNHVRSAAVTWATGFTPYWSDALWLQPTEGAPLFATALSKRVGNWIAATNPTSEIEHSPKPGGLIGARLTRLGAARLGVVELDRMPAGLMAEVVDTCKAELVDATELFAAVRAAPEAVEAQLAVKAAAIADEALASIPALRTCAGDVMQAVELSARLAGAEEVYVAVAPDLSRDTRFARVKGATPLAARFAIRVTLARHGVWIRRIATFARDHDDGTLAKIATWFDTACLDLAPVSGLANKLSETPLPAGLNLTAWFVEAPAVGRPLQIVGEDGQDLVRTYGMANLTLCLSSNDGPVLLGGPLLTKQTL